MEEKETELKREPLGERVKSSFKRFGTYMVDRFKRFTPMRCAGLVCIFILFIVFLLFCAMWTSDMVRGIPFFTDRDGNPLTGYQIGALIAFYLIMVLLFIFFIYDLFFQEISPERGPVTKDIVKGRIVEISVPGDRENQDTENTSAEGQTGADLDNISVDLNQILETNKEKTEDDKGKAKDSSR